MITHLELKSSSSLGQPPLSIDLPPSITIFVGPNNSGKSQLLNEIGKFCSGQVNHSNFW
jgi:chromosome segregation ATPase